MKIIDDVIFSAVIVTYGDFGRYQGLKHTIKSVIDAGAEKIHLINNGCDYDLFKLVKNDFDTNNISILNFKHNMGSAVGFTSGIKIATQDDEISMNEFILILDDDVSLNSQFKCILTKLEQNFDDISKHFWSLFREGRDSTLNNPGDLQIKYYLNSIAGFNIFTSKANNLKPRKKELSQPVFVPWAGLCAKKNDFLQVALPNTNYFVYEDDAEYSLNILKSDYKIFKSKSLKLGENSKSWFEEKGKSQSGYRLFYKMNTMPGRYLYKVRNSVYLVKNNHLISSNIKFGLNIIIFVLAGYIKYGLFQKNSLFRLRMLIKSIVNGLKGEMGESTEWKL